MSLIFFFFFRSKGIFLAILPGKLTLYYLLRTVRDETMLPISAEIALEEMNGSFLAIVIMRLSVIGEAFSGLSRCSTEDCSLKVFCTKYKKPFKVSAIK